MIHLDTSAMIGAFAGPRLLLPAVMNALGSDQKLNWCSIAVYEWLRGPRTPLELQDQSCLFPLESAVSFKAADAGLDRGQALPFGAPCSRAREQKSPSPPARFVMTRSSGRSTKKTFATSPGCALYRPTA